MFARPIVILRRSRRISLYTVLYFVLFEILHFVQNDIFWFFVYLRNNTKVVPYE